MKAPNQRNTFLFHNENDVILRKSSNQLKHIYREGSLDKRVKIFYWTDKFIPLHFDHIEEDEEKMGFVTAAINEIENKTCIK